MSTRSINTIIGEHSAFKGHLSLENSIEIRGIFEGDITTTEDVLIRENGKVKSNIRARNIFIEGHLEGNGFADVSIVVKSKAQIKGDIRSANLQIDQGATALCKILVEDGEMKKIEAPKAE